VEYHIDGTLTHGRLAGVHPKHRPVAFHKLGIGATDVTRGNWRFCRRMAGTIGIEPRVQLETPFVCLVDGELERIVPRIRRPTRSPREILGPRLDLRCGVRVPR